MGPRGALPRGNVAKLAVVAFALFFAALGTVLLGSEAGGGVPAVAAPTPQHLDHAPLTARERLGGVQDELDARLWEASKAGGGGGSGGSGKSGGVHADHHRHHTHRHHIGHGHAAHEAEDALERDAAAVERELRASDQEVEKEALEHRPEAAAEAPLLANGTHEQQICELRDSACRRNYCRSTRDKLPPVDTLGFAYRATTRQGAFEPKDLIVHRKTKTIYKGIPIGALPPDGNRFWRHLKWRTCAVVGNAGHLKLARYGSAIDAHDVVFRINQAPTKGYEDIVGKKTSVRLLNRLWSEGYGKERDVRRYELPIEPKVVFITSRGFNLLQNFKRMHDVMKKNGKGAQVVLLNFNLVAQARELLGMYRNCLRVGGRTFTGGGVPSSGLIAIFALKDLCGQVDVYGFGSLGRRRAPYQYYNLHNTQRSRGNPTHSFAAETAVIQALAQAKLINLCGPDGCSFDRFKLRD